MKSTFWMTAEETDIELAGRLPLLEGTATTAKDYALGKIYHAMRYLRSVEPETCEGSFASFGSYESSPIALLNQAAYRVLRAYGQW